uniref:Uncharacterized protein n=1 Tax=Alexandrium catenella TaxID=2925 RepID=A0A7S1M6U2_ALECA
MGRPSARSRRLAGYHLWPDADCQAYPYIKFIDDEYRNLLNLGPDTGNGEGMSYASALQTEIPGESRIIKVIMNATDARYRPWRTKSNGLIGNYGVINLQPRSTANFLVKFYDIGDNGDKAGRLEFPRMAFTVYDMDTGPDGEGVESVTLDGFDEYILADDSEVLVEDLDDGRTRFSGTTPGDHTDNSKLGPTPGDPQALSALGLKRALTVTFTDLRTLRVQFKVSDAKAPRFFQFAFRPTVPCGAQVLPSLEAVGPLQTAIEALAGHKFQIWRAYVGDEVQVNDPIAVSTDPNDNDKTHTYRTPVAGTVKYLQLGLVETDDIDSWAPNRVIAVIEEPPPSMTRLAVSRDKGLIDSGVRVEAGSAPTITDGDAQRAASINGAAARVAAREWTGQDLQKKETRAEKAAETLYFEKYLKEVGDTVRRGEEIAMVKYEKEEAELMTDKGSEVRLVATHSGVVAERHEDLKPYEPLTLIPDHALMTLARFPPLKALDDQAVGATIPDDVELQEWKVQVGDTVKAKDVIAVVSSPGGGKERNVQALQGGVIASLQPLQPGDSSDRIEGSSSVLALVGKFPPLAVNPPDDVATDYTATNGKYFLAYRVTFGQQVLANTRVAVLADENGNPVQLLAPVTGTVASIVVGLKEGMDLQHVLSDTNLVTITEGPVNITATPPGSAEEGGSGSGSGSMWMWCFLLVVPLCCIAGLVMFRSVGKDRPLE